MGVEGWQPPDLGINVNRAGLETVGEVSSRDQGDVVWSTVLTDLETKRAEVFDGMEDDKDRVGLDPG